MVSSKLGYKTNKKKKTQPLLSLQSLWYLGRVVNVIVFKWLTYKWQQNTKTAVKRSHTAFTSAGKQKHQQVSKHLFTNDNTDKFQLVTARAWDTNLRARAVLGGWWKIPKSISDAMSFETKLGLSTGRGVFHIWADVPNFIAAACHYLSLE